VWCRTTWFRVPALRIVARHFRLAFFVLIPRLCWIGSTLLVDVCYFYLQARDASGKITSGLQDANPAKSRNEQRKKCQLK